MVISDSGSLDYWLQKVQQDPQQPEHWVRLLLAAVAFEDEKTLAAVFDLRDQLFGDSVPLFFQSLYSPFVEKDPSLQRSVKAMAGKVGVERAEWIVLKFISGCLLMNEGSLEKGLAQWAPVTNFDPGFSPVLGIIPQIAKLAELAPMFLTAEMVQARMAGPLMPLPEYQWIGQPEKPESGDDRPCVFAACDGVYFRRFAPRFIDAAGTLGPIHIHVVNPDAVLRAELEAERIEGRSYTLEDNPDRASSAYYASVRFLCVSDIQAVIGRDFLIMDIDLEDARDLDRLVSHVRGHDLAYFDTGFLVPWIRHHAAFIYLGRGSRARAFMARFRDYLRILLPEGRWFVDQIALLCACHANESLPDGADILHLTGGAGYVFEDFFEPAGIGREKHGLRQAADKDQGEGV